MPSVGKGKSPQVSLILISFANLVICHQWCFLRVVFIKTDPRLPWEAIMWLFGLYQQFQIPKPQISGSHKFAECHPILSITALEDWWDFRNMNQDTDLFDVGIWELSHCGVSCRLYNILFLPMQGKCSISSLYAHYMFLLHVVLHVTWISERWSSMKYTTPPWPYPDIMGL